MEVDTNNIIKSCLEKDERYLQSKANDQRMTDDKGNIILPQYLGNLPDKMKVESHKIKLRLKDQYN